MMTYLTEAEAIERQFEASVAAATRNILAAEANREVAKRALRDAVRILAATFEAKYSSKH